MTKKRRTSRTQKQILKCLVAGLKNGRKNAKSTVLNAAVVKCINDENEQAYNAALEAYKLDLEAYEADKTQPKPTKPTEPEEISIHPNHFRTSCALLQERGLIMRGKEAFDWFIWLTPEGFEFIENLENEHKS